MATHASPRDTLVLIKCLRRGDIAPHDTKEPHQAAYGNAAMLIPIADVPRWYAARQTGGNDRDPSWRRHADVARA